MNQSGPAPLDDAEGMAANRPHHAKATKRAARAAFGAGTQPRINEPVTIIAAILVVATPALADYTTIKISSYLNGNVQLNPGTFPVGLTTGNVGNAIPFQTAAYGPQGYMGSAFLAGRISPGTSSSLTINLASYGLTGQSSMYALLNNYFGQAGVNEYNVTIGFVGGQSETYASIGGQDTRDYNYLSSTTQSIANTTANWWTNIATHSPTAFQRLDVREFTIAPQYQSLGIQSLTITQLVSGDPAFLSGLTFSTLPPIALNTVAQPSSLSNITTATGNTFSALGVTLNPTFDGGTLTNGASATTASNFTVTNNGGRIDAAGFTLTFSGVISNATPGSAGPLVIANSGQNGGVVLSGVNTFTGGLQVQAGAQLSIPAGSALGSGALQLLGAGSTPAILAVTGTTIIANPVQVTGPTTWAIGTGAMVTQSGVIANGSSAGGIEVAGAGTLNLTAANTYTGPTTIDAGATLAISGAGNIASSSAVTANGAFDISGAVGSVPVTSLAGAGAVAAGVNTLILTGPSGQTFSGAVNTGAGGVAVTGGVETLSGVVSGAGTVSVSGGGVLGLTGAANTYSGGTLVSGTGTTIRISSAGGLGAGTVTLTNGGALAFVTSVPASAPLANAISLSGAGGTINTNGVSGTLSGVLSGTGALDATGSGVLTLTAASTYTGATTIDAGTTLVLAGAGSASNSAGVLANGTLDVSQAIIPTIQSLAGGGGVKLGTGSLNLTQASGTFGGVISGPGGLTVAAGAQTLTGVNTFTGAVAINAGATLALANAAAVAASSGVMANGAFDISGANAGVTITTLGGAGTVNLGAQTLTLAQASGSFAGVVSGSGGLAITGGTQTLTGANSYTGGTAVNGATLAVNSDAALGGAAGGLALTNATLTATANLYSARAVTLTGANTIGTGGNAVTLSGIASGAGGLTVTGGGLVTLAGANTYTGGTRVTGGAVLAITSDASLGGAGGALALDNGGLRGLGNVSTARATTIGPGGGTLDANGGILSLSGPIVLNGPLTSTGSGSVFVTSQAQGTGTLTIANGLVSDSGQINAQNVIVTSSGMLRGIGTVAAPTQVMGIVAPGNSPGTLTFLAPVTLAAGSVTEFDIDGAGAGTGAGNYSRILVKGAGNTLTANGTVLPLLRGITGSASNTYVPPVGQMFTVIAADGGVIGSFSALTQPAGLAAGTRFDAIYGPNTVSLVITPASFADLALAGIPETSAEIAAGLALDVLRPAPASRSVRRWRPFSTASTPSRRHPSRPRWVSFRPRSMAIR